MNLGVTISFQPKHKGLTFLESNNFLFMGIFLSADLPSYSRDILINYALHKEFSRRIW